MVCTGWNSDFRILSYPTVFLAKFQICLMLNQLIRIDFFQKWVCQNQKNIFKLWSTEWKKFQKRLEMEKLIRYDLF